MGVFVGVRTVSPVSVGDMGDAPTECLPPATDADSLNSGRGGSPYAQR